VLLIEADLSLFVVVDVHDDGVMFSFVASFKHNCDPPELAGHSKWDLLFLALAGTPGMSLQLF
jgi:hypothetical protein